MVIVLHYRRLKQVQSELTEDVLNLKRLDLGEASCKQDESNKSNLGQSPTPKLEQDEKYEDDINSIEDRFVEINMVEGDSEQTPQSQTSKLENAIKKPEEAKESIEQDSIDMSEMLKQDLE
ncbi:hypothetical protein G6F36_015026 [Rhizopus arrhizus]|nr:hypothetical protein G6F36_015026 [Rhizopus arrhizus]